MTALRPDTSQDTRSAAAFARAREVIPGGVNSPVRAFLSVGGTPRFIARAKGAYLWDLDGNELVDLICSWGPMLLGHAHPEVLGAVANPDLGGVSALLGSPAGATVGWVHFLAFDLFVARWAYLDSRERGVNPFIMAPVLFLVLMLGPVGFLAYLAVREMSGARAATREAAA